MKVSRPLRVRRAYVQTLVAPPEQVFPLLCPVREAEWATGWNPREVISDSGVLEPGCIFIVPEDAGESIWVVTRRDAREFLVEFIKVTPGFTVGQIEILLRNGDEGRTLAEVAYTYTALTPKGSEFVDQFTEDRFQAWMRDWEEELNHFLRTGKKRNP